MEEKQYKQLKEIGKLHGFYVPEEHKCSQIVADTHMWVMIYAKKVWKGGNYEMKKTS